MTRWLPLKILEVTTQVIFQAVMMMRTTGTTGMTRWWNNDKFNTSKLKINTSKPVWKFLKSRSLRVRWQEEGRITTTVTRVSAFWNAAVGKGLESENIIKSSERVANWLIATLFSRCIGKKKLHKCCLKGRGQLKKNVFFRALPELPNPPPHDPNSGNLVLFFRKSKFKIWKSV